MVFAGWFQQKEIGSVLRIIRWVVVPIGWVWGRQVFRTGQIVKIGWVDLTVETDTTERIFLVCPFFNGNILGAEIR